MYQSRSFPFLIPNIFGNIIKFMTFILLYRPNSILAHLKMSSLLNLHSINVLVLQYLYLLWLHLTSYDKPFSTEDTIIDFKSLLGFLVHKASRSRDSFTMSWFTVLVLHIPFGLWFVAQPYPPFSLIKFLFTCSKESLHHITSFTHVITVNRLWFSTLDGNYLWLVYL